MTHTTVTNVLVKKVTLATRLPSVIVKVDTTGVMNVTKSLNLKTLVKAMNHRKSVSVLSREVLGKEASA